MEVGTVPRLSIENISKVWKGMYLQYIMDLAKNFVYLKYMCS